MTKAGDVVAHIPHPTYLRFFTSGDLITLGAAVIAIAVSWGSLSAQMKHQGESLQELRAELGAVKDTKITPETEARLMVLEQRAKETDEFRLEMRAEVRLINTKMDKVLERLPRPQ